MNISRRMQRGKRICKRGYDCLKTNDINTNTSIASAESIGERTSIGQIHNEKCSAIFELAYIMDGDEVVTSHGSKLPSLIHKTFSDFWVQRVIGCENFYSNRAAQRIIVCAYYNSEPTDAENATGFVSTYAFR